MEIAIDFDGTCVTHEFPAVGKDIGAAPVLRKLVENGHKLIVFTMRADRELHKETGHPDILDVTGTFLTDALKWFSKNGIELHGIQTNPTQCNWTTSPKCYAHLYLDDAALGAPLKTDPEISDRPFYNWVEAERMLKNMRLI